MHSKNQPAAHVPQSVVSFTHLTIQTGHIVEQNLFRPEIQESAGNLLPCTEDGSYILFGQYTLFVCTHSQGHRSFAVWRGQHPLVVCEACLDANYCAEAWQASMSNVRQGAQAAAEVGHWPEPILGFYFQTPVLRKPPGLFLAVWLAPGLEMEREPLFWLGDFERCFYVALWNRLQMDVPACLAGKQTHENGATQPAKD